jgi:hypothetical protein
MKSLILISIRLGGNTGERAKLPESPSSKSSGASLKKTGYPPRPNQAGSSLEDQEEVCN